MSNLDVLYCGDHVYNQGIYLSALSAVKRTKAPIHFHLMTMSVKDKGDKGLPISENDRLAFEKMIKEFNPSNEVYVYDVTKAYQDTLAKTKNHKTDFSPYCMVRLFADSVLPKDIKNLIYMDADTMVVNSLEAFLEYDLNGHEFMAALDYLGEWWLHSDYFNSGVMYLNMEKIRETDLFARCRQLLLTKKLAFPDQDALYQLNTSMAYLPRKFNEQRYKDYKKDTIISHWPNHVWKYWDPVRPWHIDKMHKRYKIHSFDEEYKYWLANFPFEELNLKRPVFKEK